MDSHPISTEKSPTTLAQPEVSDAEPAVKATGLVKAYGSARAVAGLDLDIRRGEIFALLGPNGAGKTTTIEILEGYRARDAGEVHVLGLDPATERAGLKRRIGIVLQSTGIEPYLTVGETLAMYSELYPRPRRVEELLQLVGLTAKRDDKVVSLSGGQQRRLDMAIAFAGDPELLFLDEPTTGFDPKARREAWEVIKSMASLGTTVVLTTHFMDEAQYLADRVAVMAAGRLVAEGPPSTLGLRHRAKARVRYRLPEGVNPPAGLGELTGSDGFVQIAVDDPVAELHRLFHWAAERSVEIAGLEVTRPSLEDVYLELTSGPGPGR
jgi:ABC-2 type transport system ATP-binding protein